MLVCKCTGHTSLERYRCDACDFDECILCIDGISASLDMNKYAAMPWHLVDIWWDIGIELPFQRISMDITISTDVPTSVNMYISPIGLAHMIDSNRIYPRTPFYGGIQTHSDGNTKCNPNLVGIGPGALFSMWNERHISSIRPADGGIFQSSGHEGDFVSVRRAYQWSKGKYTYSLIKMDAECVNGKWYTWVGCFLYSHEKNENIFVGALRFPGLELVLHNKIANFIEIYGPLKPVEDIPKVVVKFGRPVVNFFAYPCTATAVYSVNVPAYAVAGVEGGSVVVTVGELDTSRTDLSQRSMLLLTNL